ncbi:MAG: anthranilate synthase component II [Francisellaceae bacterium]
MILFIDHFDSFSAILSDYITQLGLAVDKVTTDHVQGINIEKYTHIIIGPGPGHPTELLHLYPLLDVIVEKQKPLLGICLGHQLIAQYFGAEIIPADNIMHGQLSQIYPQNHDPIYRGLNKKMVVTRYHSLIIDPNSMTYAPQLQVIATTAQDEIMAIAHQSLPIRGIQYHPEAYLTEHGLTVLHNFFT